MNLKEWIPLVKQQMVPLLMSNKQYKEAETIAKSYLNEDGEHLDKNIKEDLKKVMALKLAEIYTKMGNMIKSQEVLSTYQIKRPINYREVIFLKLNLGG